MKLNFPAPLTEKHRPRTVDAFIGLTKPKKILEAFVERPFDAAFLFLGPSGIGKTTLAMAIGEQIEAEIHQIASRQCDLETVDSVTRMCNFAAFNFTTGKPAPWHVVIVNECDQMTMAAQHSFLSKLDSTAAPPKSIFFFTANSTQGLEDRFLSRCRVINFESDSLEEELPRYLAKIYKREGGRHPLKFDEIATLSGFNVRDSLMKLEMELLIGADRSDLPPEKELEIIEQHTHSCKKCAKFWKHADLKCELPYRSLCHQCGGGPKTAGQVRAGKAWQTIRQKIEKELNEKSSRRGGSSRGRARRGKTRLGVSRHGKPA